MIYGLGQLTSLSILAVADLHDHDVELLRDAVRTLTPDIVVFAGDGLRSLTDRADSRWLTDLASHAKVGLLAVEGNADDGALSKLVGHKVYDLQQEAFDVGPFRFVGLAGAPASSSRVASGLGAPLYSDAQSRRHLTRQLSGHSGPFILVTHAPPHGVLDYSVSFGERRGSRAVRELLNTSDRCRLVICGHVHSSGGLSETVGRTVVWNVASDQREASSIGVLYLRLEWCHGDALISAVSPFGSYLHWGRAGELGFLHEMQAPVAAKLVAGGITTVRQLAETDVAHVAACLGWRKESAAVWPARARAFVTRRPVALGPLPISPLPRWYIDIETDAHGGRDLLWAVSLMDHEGRDKSQWYLTSLRGQRGMLRAVSRALESLPEKSLHTYSGSRFDERLLEWHFRRHGITVPRSVATASDLRWPLQRAFALPGRAALKEAIQAFGVSHGEDGMDGLTAALRATAALERRRKIPSALLRYNREDVRVLRDLIDAVEKQVGITAPMPRRSRPSGGALRKAADERRAAVLLANAGLTLEQLARSSNYVSFLIERNQRVTSATIERELSIRGMLRD